MVTVQFILDEGGHVPTKAHPNDVGWDIYAIGNDPHITVSIDNYGMCVLHTGLHAEIPYGWYGQLATRSSMATDGVFVVGGVIDSDYRGEIKVILYNSRNRVYWVPQTVKIAQLLILPVPVVTWEQVETLGETARGVNGFGSSGR